MPERKTAAPISNAARRRAEPKVEIQMTTSVSGVGWYMQTVKVRKSVAWAMVDTNRARWVDLPPERDEDSPAPDELTRIDQSDNG